MLEVSELEHGLLTYSLLQGMTGLQADSDNNREVIEREWLNYAVSEVPKLQEAKQKQRDAAKGVKTRSDLFGGEANSGARILQTPRVFYRRETGPQPFVIARP